MEHETPQMRFTKAVNQVLDSGAVTKKEIAQEFGIGLCTVDRWVAGESMPQTHAVPYVMRFLESKMKTERPR